MEVLNGILENNLSKYNIVTEDILREEANMVESEFNLLNIC